MSPIVFNATPFASQSLLMMDAEGQLMFCILVCATYRFDAAGAPYPAPDQVAVPLADEPGGEPGRSSLRRAAAPGVAKAAVDFIVTGSAHAPSGSTVSALAVGVRVGTWTKVLNVVGDRQWGGVLGRRASVPRPFATLPICYERAFGGSLFDAAGSTTACHAENPVGIGWKGARSADASVASQLPNIAPLGQRMDSPDNTFAVAGLGVVAPHWAPRSRYAGTYDKVWLETRFPVAPKDIDARFAQCAPADQQWPDARPNVDVQLLNLTPQGRWRFRMPSADLGVTVLHSNGTATHRLRVDTIHVDAEAQTVSLTARHCLTELRSLGLVREVVIGEASAAWRRARLAGKRYIGRSAPATAD